MEETLRRTSLAPHCVPLLCTLLRGGNTRVCRLPGDGGDHFHCTVEPSPGYIFGVDSLLLQLTPAHGDQTLRFGSRLAQLSTGTVAFMHLQ